MWNYRVVRKRNVHVESTEKCERVDYTYAIHEAFYDDNGYVGAITQEPVEPFGENVEELRHCWLMMAEAFGQPILDYDNIPEPGYERGEDPLGVELDERLGEMESGEVESIPWEEVKRDWEEKWGPFDEKAYRKELEDERLEKERYHCETFIGISAFEELIRKIYSDYREYVQRDMTENPCKYKDDGDEGIINDK